MAVLPKIQFRAGDETQGYRIEAVTPLEKLHLAAYRIEHIKSGARIMHLHTADSENLFSINFPTPPPDDTGLPHILEHCVLGGSRKFPVREPFFEMLKMSMATFLNAMTGPDCTYYPVASNVKADLFNLADVYFDAVFHPTLSERTFRREGHHLAPRDPNAPTGALTVNGIVFSEMKGAFSDPEARLFRCASQQLLPDTVYGRESGGDPERIPDLTYDDFLRFHRTYYHPSNAYFIVYGDIPTEEYLAFLKDRLDAFDRSDFHPVISHQPRWGAPRTVADSYPIGQDEPETQRTYVLMNWLVGDATDADEIVRLEILSQILLGNEAAPLKKAIIDSGLGEDLILSGGMAWGCETIFRVGIKGTEADRIEAFTALVSDTLTQLADQPLDPERVQSAYRQTLYRHREIGSHYPLETMDRVLSAWRYGVDPLRFLHMEEHLDRFWKGDRSDPQLFNRFIRERLVENPHCLTVVLKPDRAWMSRTEAAFAERLKQIRSGLSEEAVRKLIVEAGEIQREAGTPNLPEALAKLPQLNVSDVPAAPRDIPTTVEQLNGGVTFLENRVFANGINYLHLNFDLTGLPQDLWPVLPRYIEALHKLGAAGMNYEQIARRVASATGGIHAAPSLDTHASDPTRSLRGLRVTLKTLDDQMDDALYLLHDLLFGLDPRDEARLRDVLVQARAYYRSHLVHDGADTAARHAARGLTPEGHLAEIVNGLPQLDAAEKLTGDFDSLGEELMQKIEALRDFMLVRERLTLSFTGSDSAGRKVRSTVNGWIDRMPSQPVVQSEEGFVPYDRLPREGLAGPLQVAYCAKVMRALHLSHADEPLLTLAAHLLTFEHFLAEIRLKGNAYGAWCRYYPLRRILHFGSYRDPHVVRTLNVFDDTLDYVRQAEWTPGDIERAIIGAAKADERPIRPESATALALKRHLTGQTPGLRKQRRKRMLAATPGEVKRTMIDLLESQENHAAVCVVASREKLEEANRQLGDKGLVLEDILK